MDILLPDPVGSLLKIERGAVTNFFGGPGTGKTNLCLLAVKDCLRKGGKVVFLDTEGGFSPERFRQISGGLEVNLSGVNILEPRDFREQGKAIRGLSKVPGDLIVVDSMVALYRLEYSDENSTKKQILEANRELSKQLSILSALARERKIPVVITTHTFRNWDTGEHEVIGGNTLKYWCKAIVFLERTSRMSERKATLTKHRHLAEGQSVKFQLVQEGIRPSGFRFF